MQFRLVQAGPSRSFPDPHPLLSAAGDSGDAVLITGAQAGEAYAQLSSKERLGLVLIELSTECLGAHTGEQRGEEGGNVLGFARFRLGDSAPSNLVEIVRQPRTTPTALAEARALFESHALKTAVCEDFPGRIIDRLLRPYYNAVLDRLDTKLASAADIDLTLKLGLGYPEGPIELLERTGLAAHHDVTLALYTALAEKPYAPARRAQVAKARSSP